MIIGRKREQEELINAANAEYSKFVAVYGRRRVGKTFLIRETFNYTFTFQHTGLARGKMREQLLSFHASLHNASGKKYPKFKNWYEAFFAESRSSEYACNTSTRSKPRSASQASCPTHTAGAQRQTKTRE